MHSRPAAHRRDGPTPRRWMLILGVVGPLAVGTLTAATIMPAPIVVAGTTGYTLAVILDRWRTRRKFTALQAEIARMREQCSSMEWWR